jgi:hypothetical protein
MRKDDVAKLPNGVYRVHWKFDAGISVAAIGTLPDGKRWIAPANWTTPTWDTVASGYHWHRIERVELIESADQARQLHEAIINKGKTE